MSKAKPPWIAAKKAERDRRQRRKERLMLAGVILLMIVSMVADGFYLKHFYFNKPRPPTKTGRQRRGSEMSGLRASRSRKRGIQ